LVMVSSDASNSIALAVSGNGVQVSSHSVALNWDPSTSVVVGYYVYRQTLTSTLAKLNAAPVVLTQLTDSNVQSRQTYTYMVTAVDADNNESDYSDAAVVSIP
jgi:fibronectin type 3 domain-containing protein